MAADWSARFGDAAGTLGIGSAGAVQQSVLIIDFEFFSLDSDAGVTGRVSLSAVPEPPSAALSMLGLVVMTRGRLFDRSC